MLTVQDQEKAKLAHLMGVLSAVHEQLGKLDLEGLQPAQLSVEDAFEVCTDVLAG